MTLKQAFSNIVRLVPHWYESDHAPCRYETQVGDDVFGFSTHRPMTARTERLWEYIQDKLPEFFSLVSLHSASIGDCIQEALVEKWLTDHSAEVDWKRVLKYVHYLRYRTCANAPVTMNLVFSEGAGIGDLDEDAFNKKIDRIATSSFTFVRSDFQVRSISYEEISWSQIVNTSADSTYPQFLHPFFCLLNDDPNARFSLHITENRDVLIMDRTGVIAASRKGMWRIYDCVPFQEAIGDAVGHESVACTFLSMLFDLSFRRHGGLLIYDPESVVLNHVINRESLLSEMRNTKLQMIENVVRGVNFRENGNPFGRKRRILIELSSIDGAIIFNNDGILAIGALVEQHPEVGSHVGARTTAAVSALKWGGIPAKISSDGDVSIYFRSVGQSGEADAVIRFS